MPGLRHLARQSLNGLLHPLGAEIVRVAPLARRMAADGGKPLYFHYRGRSLPHFVHHHNCGMHPLVATERTVELAIADQWLAGRQPEEVIEIGAVTPYYWPYRVARIVDPCDPHPRVTDRCRLAQVDLKGCAVLSISTFEHIGTSDYDLVPDSAALRQAFRQLFAQAGEFLVTVPLGYNPACDDFIRAKCWPAQVALTVLEHAEEPPYWQVVSSRQREWIYGQGRAHAVAVLERSASIAATAAFDPACPQEATP